METLCAQTVERLERHELAYEDAIPVLYLKEQMEGLQRNTAIRHLFIDGTGLVPLPVRFCQKAVSTL